ncbi:substrate-binding domain-containing protein [Belnapia rosea]|uniref:Molybdate transport system substrate-binding protein n=1 Tax=Belnapia rosea TaxID=938405 RepID=A0A1G6ZYP1_9PROT|nr:substrate-binding domain-containing protein [Belnapia rosea]SDB69334.1 molybdate transport system substrate-binding protein [Belnapia rosea]SDE07768.1 molybdate transport system substrate-binding protein [Belnapia rosea]
MQEQPRAPLRVFSTLAVMGAMQALLPELQARTGQPIHAEFAPTAALLRRLEAGELADLAILTAEAVEALMASGTLRLGSRRDLCVSVIGVAVRAGAPRPDIATPEACRAALLGARSIAYSRAGASGIFFAGLIERMGIAEAINAKATVIPQGLTGELAARGEAELAIQQVSELMTVPGVDIVGPLPEALNTRAVFSAGVFAGAAEGAGLLLAEIGRALTPGLLEANGLLPS